MNKRILALLLALCLFVSAVPVYAGAAAGQVVSADAVTVTAGNAVTVTVKVENFSMVAALDVFIYYDAASLTLSSAANGTMLSNAQASVNTAEAGKVTLSMMALNGISGTGNLLTLRFTTSASCSPGKYPVTVATGRAVDTDLQPVVVQSVSGSVTVSKPVQTETFTVYGYTSSSTLQRGDILSYRVASSSSSRSFVSGEFTVEYDHEIFAFDSATMESALTGEGAVYSINSSVLGQVRIAYANDDPVKSFYLYTVNLKVIANTEGKTTIKTNATNMYRQDLTLYQPGSYSNTVNLTKAPEVKDHPNAFLKTEELIVGRQSTSVFCLEAGAGVGAADFTVTYDPAVLRCLGVTMAQDVTEKGGMIVINDNYAEGTIRFSYVNMQPVQEELTLVTILWEPLQSPENHTPLTLSGKGVVDAAQKTVVLEYVPTEDCIFTATVFPPCVADGYTLFACGCGQSYQAEPVPMEGHILQYFDAREATCTESGWTAHEGCTRCDYKTVQLIPSLGHRVRQVRAVWTDPVSVDLGSYSTPFTLENGTYYSNNHDNSTATELKITALYDCSLSLNYGVSSEQNYDKLFIILNALQQDVISGIVSNKELTLELAAGDVVTVRYSKDGSVGREEDRGWVTLQYEQVEVDMTVDVPAEEVEPDCSGSVVCDYCHETVAEAAAHTAQSAVFFWSDDHTGCQAELSCSVCLQTVLKDCVITDAPSEPGVTVHIASVTEGESTFTDMLTCENFRVTFLDRDGSAICEDWYHPGRPVAIPQLQERTAQDGFVFTFTGWDKEVSPVCTENAVYTATYEATLLGDVNGDGQVDARDRAILTRFLANWEGYEINALAADVNMDGQVDATDRAILTRHLANWQDYMQLPYIQP